MARRPPDLGRQVMTLIAQRLDRLREKDRLTDRGRFRRKALLLHLGPEGGEVRRDRHACDDVGIGLFKGIDLRREIIRQVLIAARICQTIALGGQGGWEANIWITPCIAVPVIREQPADLLVGIELVPHGSENRDHVLKPPEEVERVIKRLPGSRIAGVALLANEIRLPRRNGRDHGDFLGLTGRRDRVGCFRRRGHEHHVDLVVQDELFGDFGSAVGVGLAVLDDDFKIPTDGGIHKAIDDKAIRLGKCRQRTGLRADIAQLDLCAHRQRRGRKATGGQGQAACRGCLE